MALRPEPSDASKTAPSGQPCGVLGRAVARAFRGAKPDVLMLGPLCGESVVYLAGRGGRVHVDEVALPEPIPKRQPGEPPATVAPFKIDHASGAYDVVLAWEILDFVPPERLHEFGQELTRLLKVGGQLIVFAHQKPLYDRAVMPRYRLLADDLIVREEPDGPVLKRYVHPNREIERAITGLSVQNIHLQRNQLREILALKVGVG